MGIAAMGGMIPFPIQNTAPPSNGFRNVINLMMAPISALQTGTAAQCNEDGASDSDTALTNLTGTGPTQIAAALIRSMLKSGSLFGVHSGDSSDVDPKTLHDQDANTAATVPALPALPVLATVPPAPTQTQLSAAVPDVSPLAPTSGATQVDSRSTQPKIGLPPGSMMLPAGQGTASRFGLAFAARLTPSDPATGVTPDSIPSRPGTADLQSANPVPEPNSAMATPAGVAAHATSNAAQDQQQSSHGQGSSQDQPSSQDNGTSDQPDHASPLTIAESKSKTGSRDHGDASADALPAAAPASAGALGNHAGDFSRLFATQPAPTAAGSTTSTATIDATSKSGAASNSEPVPPPAVPHSPATQGITVRISQPDSPAVDLHVVERRGEVQVAVRTPDTGLQNSLRQDLGTLVNSLQRSGYHTETFTPREGLRPTSSSSESNSSGDRQGGSNQDGSNQGRSNQGRSNQGGTDSRGGRHQQQRDSRRLAWLKELEIQA